jgi:hypothetical protein
MNHHASMNGFVWDPETCHIRLRCSACVHAETVSTIKTLFGAAVTLQAADAHIKVGGIATLLGGTADISQHPKSGPRREADDMLNVIEELYAPQGRRGSPYTADTFLQAAAMSPAPWLDVQTEGAELRAVLYASDYPSGTGVFMATSNPRHPQLGAGLLTLVNIPSGFTPEVTLALAHELNLAEAYVWQSPYFFGAWCVGKDADPGLTFASFYPAAVCRPGLVEALAVQAGVRAAWVRRQIDDGIQDAKDHLNAVCAGTDSPNPESTVRRAIGRSLLWNADDAAGRLEKLLSRESQDQVADSADRSLLRRVKDGWSSFWKRRGRP